MDYSAFLDGKRTIVKPAGFQVDEALLSDELFDYQRTISSWGLRKGKCGLFLDTGLGKSAVFLEMADQIVEHERANVLILAPLAVSYQIAREGKKFGINVHVCGSQADVQAGINVTNYERLHLFEASKFVAVVLDEGSILKSKDGKTRNYILDTFKHTPYKVVATATPSPNDYMELGTYAEFLGLMSYSEMLSTFFVHDGGDTSKWRLKGHAENDFYRWLASWSVAMRNPADLGFDGTRHILPPKTRHEIVVQGTVEEAQSQGWLFPMEALTLMERRGARKASIDQRVTQCAEVVNGIPTDEKCIIWCNLNAEGDALTDAISGAVQVQGADSAETKERVLLDFAHGSLNRLVTKPSIAGFGLNLQSCRYNFFVGLSDSFEEFYQAERRTWRFGQEREVHTYIITSETEGQVLRNINRKEEQHHSLMDSLVAQMRTEMRRELGCTTRTIIEYNASKEMQIPGWLKSERLAA